MTHAPALKAATFTGAKGRPNGFTLVQTAFLILLLGLFIGASISFLKVEGDTKKEQLTKARMQKIAIALHDYAEQRGGLPCPSLPDVNIGEDAHTCNAAAYQNGVVPFKDLGLTQADIVDGYGNPFTFVVSRTASMDGRGTTAHDNCRTSAWFQGGVAPNLNPNKAIFCCQQAYDNDSFNMRVSDGGARVITTQNGNAGGGSFVSPNSPATAVSTNLAYFAYALISHGKNGLGSYIFGNPSHKSMTGAGADEKENGDNDIDFVAKPADSTPGNYFDDIVLWRTQEQVIAETGDDSCTRP